MRAILTGRVVQRGDSLNIQTELVDVAEVSQLWGQQYDRKFTEILAVQEEIARQVSEKLRLRPTGEEQKRMTKRSTENTEAYQLYLKGRYYWNRRTADLLKKANEYFQQAIDKDPSYGLAYAGLAESYALFSFYEVLPPSEACPKAKAAAMKALEIDETLAEAHAALGWVKMTCDWDWAGQGDGSSSAPWKSTRTMEQRGSGMGSTSRRWGGWTRPSPSAGARLEAEPLSLIISATLGRDFYLARHYDQAIEELRKTLDMDPSFVEAHLYLGWVYEQKGMFPQAIAELQAGLDAFRRLSPIRQLPRSCLCDFGTAEDGGGVPGPAKGAVETTVRRAVRHGRNLHRPERERPDLEIPGNGLSRTTLTQ